MNQGHFRSLRVGAALGLALVLGACSGGHRSGAAGGEGGRLSIKGSDTMVVLAQRLAERFMATHEGVALEVSGGGSGTGISALLSRTTDVASTSRALHARERTLLEGAGGAHETPVAIDAIAVYVHEDNPLSALTLTQLRDIYRGRVTRWSELGGPDRPIVLYSRENNSGTYAYFKDVVLEGLDFAVEAQTLPGTAAVINAVSQDRYGIGYGGIGYGGRVRAVPLVSSAGEPVAPEPEAAISGAYPLARPLFFVTRGAPRGLAAEFLDWVRSPEGQALVDRVGFFPLPPDAAQ